MAIIKIKKIKLKNLRNVRHGEVTLAVSFETFLQANVVGLYGQNGSGKTTIVDAFGLLKTLISGWLAEVKLPSQEKRLILAGEDTASLDFEFLVENQFGTFFVHYYVELQEDQHRLYTTLERLTYRENDKGKRSKVLMAMTEKGIQIRNSNLPDMSEQARIQLLVIQQLARKEYRSFLFHKDLKPLLQERLTEQEIQLIKNIAVDFNRDLHVVNNQNIAPLFEERIMPFSIHLEKTRGQIPYDLKGPALLPEDEFYALCEVIEQSNRVLAAIIPGLTIKINIITKQTMDDGGQGIRFEFLSQRGEQELPLRTESEGILKIISILSVLIAVYNNPNACVVIDELDSGVFEYLLGELLTVIDEDGKGQLVFTSHNLRVLEVLAIKNLWFTTTNENHRYMQLKGIKEINNARDVYLRAIQLGGQDEEVYKETKTFKIKRAFRKAGVQHD
ncbi:AAA family ATPase [Lysinibacillus fusiformis]|uniref:AAA family ATPase n=1 Tax=Lysinibacillus fusiformis TaxID=28031 RepID=UPI000882F355|nr:MULTISPECIES: AAA family ATPase [Lysinibacillus]MED4670081.1 AAA family ATPase [Lysinibacillus fusiformis]QAS57604.1 ATP-binding protein [Lysinibacillus sphaericus]RDV29999.1 ATP-binding protein [Lysinibacillus fusiformis]SCX68328.1 ATPase/GTPase, AAA15 family [Lysinibacillus fusiformis]SDB55462.1 ATPase/GTPase, AAA15 family [Lysinibacillus fusiformis]